MNAFHCRSQNRKDIALFIKRLMVRALYQELQFYPKPGLVSFIDTGAHQDMTAVTLYKSLFSLRHYFYEVAVATLNLAPNCELVKLGQQAEAIMMETTDGINTHRGAIFALGIFASTLAKLCYHNRRFDSQTLHHALIADWRPFLLDHNITPSNGTRVRARYDVVGAKELALSGYAPIFSVFNRIIHFTEPTFSLRAYCQVFLVLDDNNVLHRVGWDGLQKAKNAIELINFHQPIDRLILQMSNLHQQFTRLNVSPGGVADMMAILYVLRQLFAKDAPCDFA